MPEKLHVEIGRRFGRWTVQAVAADADRSGTRALCRCECGTERRVHYSSIVSGKSQSCGCWNAERRWKHGHSTHLGARSEYQTWTSMKHRCVSRRAREYERYGGRGIKVCERWADSFENFLADMGRKPSPAHSLDRIDNDGDYEPANCRWATPVQQARNTSQNRFLTIRGETLTVSEWASRVGISRNALNGRLNHGWTPEEAIAGQFRLFVPGRWGWRARK